MTIPRSFYEYKIFLISYKHALYVFPIFDQTAWVVYLTLKQLIFFGNVEFCAINEAVWRYFFNLKKRAAEAHRWLTKAYFHCRVRRFICPSQKKVWRWWMVGIVPWISLLTSRGTCKHIESQTSRFKTFESSVHL